MFCKNCGKELNENSKFCDGCGQSVESKAVEQTQQGTTNNSNPFEFEQSTGNIPNVRQKKKKGCLPVIIGLVAIIILVGIFNSITPKSSASNSNSDTQGQQNSTKKEEKTQEEVVAEGAGVSAEVSANIVSILNSCEVKTITSISRYESLDNESGKAYSVTATEIKGAVFYLNAENAVTVVNWNEDNLYKDGAVVATVTQVKNRPNLEVLSVSTENDGYVGYAVGEVRNNTKKTYSYVQVEISLLNGEALVGSTLDNVTNLEPGQVWKFKAPIFTKDATQFKVKEVTGY